MAEFDRGLSFTDLLAVKIGKLCNEGTQAEGDSDDGCLWAGNAFGKYLLDLMNDPKLLKEIKQVFPKFNEEMFNDTLSAYLKSPNFSGR